MKQQTKKLKFLILGAGPSGLTLANSLIQNGVGPEDVCILEKEATVGGLCRSQIVDGAPLDVGGGHFLDVKRKNVLEFIFQFMPTDEWKLHNRISKIRINDIEVDHPLEANLWQFPLNMQVDYLESIAQAGCLRGDPMPRSFDKWMRWKLGDKISDEYMVPYNKKIWAMDPDLLGTYWLSKLPNVSFRDTLSSCIKRQSTGSLPAHGTFLYPKKYGYGELWRRMGQRLGNSLVLDCKITDINTPTLTVNHRWSADIVVNTIPWTLWPSYCKIPDEVSLAINELKYAPIDVDYSSQPLATDAHWIYEPDDRHSYHRILVRQNFVAGARGYWTETNSNRATAACGPRFRNEFAYPINTVNKPAAVNVINSWASSKKIISLGRWGRWEHMNSDVAVEEALVLAKHLVG